MAAILQTPTFKRAVKRLPKQQKLELDIAIRAIVSDPTIGEAKVGDLTGVRVHKFSLNRQLTLLAYEIIGLDAGIKLLAIGSHQNFYRDLKR